MGENESFERFREGLAKAISRARELGFMQKNRDWETVAVSLEGVLRNGTKFFNAKALSEMETNLMLDKRQKDIKVN